LAQLGWLAKKYPLVWRLNVNAINVSDLPAAQRNEVPVDLSETTPIIPPSRWGIRSRLEGTGLLAPRGRWLSQCLVRDVVVPLAVSRVALAIVALLGFHLLQLPLRSTKWEVAANGNRQDIAGHVSTNVHPFVNMWARWDGGWYLDIAKHGYSFVPGKQSSVAFFPLYPYLIRWLHDLIPLSHDAGWLLIGIVISNASLLVGLTYLYALVRLDYDRCTAARAVLYLCVFPTTLFLSAVYSESLFVALVVSAFYYARTSRWLAAGALAAAAALCRAPGVLLVIPLALEYLSQKGFQWRQVRPDCFALALAPIAFAGHLAFLRWRFGAWNIISQAEAMKGWNRHLTPPWDTFLYSFQSMNSLKGASEFFFTIAMLGLMFFTCLRLRPSYAVYAVVSLLFVTSWGALTSAPRLGIVIFPFVIALALLGRNQAFNRAYLFFSALLAAVAMVIFSQWGWVA
jgi:Gpi18-like mannosyltransferase